MTWNEGVNLSWRQFCSDWAEMFLMFFKAYTATLYFTKEICSENIQQMGRCPTGGGSKKQGGGAVGNNWGVERVNNATHPKAKAMIELLKGKASAPRSIVQAAGKRNPDLRSWPEIRRATQYGAQSGQWGDATRRHATLCTIPQRRWWNSSTIYAIKCS